MKEDLINKSRIIEDLEKSYETQVQTVKKKSNLEAEIEDYRTEILTLKMTNDEYRKFL